MENIKNVPTVPKEKEQPKQQTTEKYDDYTIEIVQDNDAVVDPFYLPNKDPRYEYRFIRADEKNISIKTSNLLHFKGGWQLPPRKHLLKIGLSDTLISKDKLAPDGLCRRGDTVLAFMPKELYEKKVAHKLKKANEPVDAIKRLIGKGDPSVAGVGHKDMKGLQTKEQMKM